MRLIQKTLPQVEKLPSEVLLNAKLNYLLYGIHSEWNDAKNATLYAQKAVELAQKSGNKNMLSSAYSAMAVCYYFPYEKTGDLKDLKRVIEMCKRLLPFISSFGTGFISCSCLSLIKSCQLLPELSGYYS